MIWFTNRQKERAIEEFVTLQKRQGEAQSAAEQAQAEYQKARNGTIEQSSKLELLSQNAKILKAKADGLESQLDVLRKNEALAFLGSQLSAHPHPGAAGPAQRCHDPT